MAGYHTNQRSELQLESWWFFRRFCRPETPIGLQSKGRTIQIYLKNGSVIDVPFSSLESSPTAHDGYIFGRVDIRSSVYRGSVRWITGGCSQKIIGISKSVHAYRVEENSARYISLKEQIDALSSELENASNSLFLRKSYVAARQCDGADGVSFSIASSVWRTLRRTASYATPES